MSAHLNPISRRPVSASTAGEVFSPQDNLRPVNKFLTDISGEDGDYCLILCTLPAGAVVPLHSHADRETFYMLSGSLDGLRLDGWHQLGSGDIVDVPGNSPHAWRNSSGAAASMICVTTARLGRFLRDISISADAAASPAEHARRFLALVKAHGYWLASPEENLAVGLDVNWGPPAD